MNLKESYHNPKVGAYQYREVSHPDVYKKHKYYKKIKKRMEDAVSKGFTLGPLVHYGPLAETDDYDEMIDINHEGSSGYGGVGNAPGGLFFSFAEGNNPEYYDLDKKSHYYKNPFSSSYFSDAMGDNGIIAMVKAKKICELQKFVERGILDDDYSGYIVDEDYYHIAFRCYKKLFPRANKGELNEIAKILFEADNSDETMPTLLSGSIESLLEVFENGKLDIYLNLMDKNVLNYLETENINKLCTFILNSYGYDGVIDVGGEIIVYDLDKIYVVGHTSDSDL